MPVIYMLEILSKSVDAETRSRYRGKNLQILGREPQKNAIFAIFNRLQLEPKLINFDEIFCMYIPDINLQTVVLSTFSLHKKVIESDLLFLLHGSNQLQFSQKFFTHHLVNQSCELSPPPPKKLKLFGATLKTLFCSKQQSNINGRNCLHILLKYSIFLHCPINFEF